MQTLIKWKSWWMKNDVIEDKLLVPAVTLAATLGSVYLPFAEFGSLINESIFHSLMVKENLEPVCLQASQ